jgi:hypothetical protein
MKLGLRESLKLPIVMIKKSSKTTWGWICAPGGVDMAKKGVCVTMTQQKVVGLLCRRRGGCVAQSSSVVRMQGGCQDNRQKGAEPSRLILVSAIKALESKEKPDHQTLQHVHSAPSTFLLEKTSFIKGGGHNLPPFCSQEPHMHTTIKRLHQQ